jgi:hypothetical protein
MRLLISLVIVAAGVLAAPVGASAAPAPDYGSTVKCHYEVTAREPGPSWSEAQLRRIVVVPPQMPAMTTTQSVGWRFVVTRSMAASRGEPYLFRYRSRIQRDVSDISFTKMFVDVQLPGDPEADRDVAYHVTLKMYWYAADGSVQNKVVYLMPNMHWVVNRYVYSPENYCPGLDAPQI